MNRGPKRSIAVLLPLSVGHARAILQGVSDYFRNRPQFWTTVVDHHGLSCIDLVAQAKPSGVIAFIFQKEEEEELVRLGVPVVSVANTIAEPRLPRVYFSDERAGQLAAEHLVHLGLRHFAFLGELHSPCIVGRLRGFEQVLSSHRLACRLLEWRKAMETWRPFDPSDFIEELKGLEKPIGLFAAYDVLAYHAARACHHGGIRVPEEVAIIGVDNDPVVCSVCQPPLSSVRIPARDIGYRAAELLEGMLNGKGPETEPIVLDPMPPQVRMSTEIVAVPDERVAKALNYIRQHAHELVGVAQMWESLRLDRKEMEARFRKVLGRSAGEEFTRVRVERVKNLVLDTEWSAQRIAEACGFSTASYMIKVFRKHVGMTPNSYRSSLRKRL